MGAPQDTDSVFGVDVVKCQASSFGCGDLTESDSEPAEPIMQEFESRSTSSNHVLMRFSGNPW